MNYDMRTTVLNALDLMIIYPLNPLFKCGTRVLKRLHAIYDCMERMEWSFTAALFGFMVLKPLYLANEKIFWTVYRARDRHYLRVDAWLRARYKTGR